MRWRRRDVNPVCQALVWRGWSVNVACGGDMAELSRTNCGLRVNG